MPLKEYKPEQILTLLPQIEAKTANGKTTAQACREARNAAAREFQARTEI
jgi:putative transposase